MTGDAGIEMRLVAVEQRDAGKRLSRAPLREFSDGRDLSRNMFANNSGIKGIAVWFRDS